MALGEGLDGIEGSGPDGDGRPGAGGVNRGRGDADLWLSGRTKGDTDRFKAERLPPGTPMPDPGVRLAVGRAGPETDAHRDGGAGQAGAEGAGVAAWQRRLAPHVRDVVRGFFGPAGAQPPADAKASPK